MDNNTINNNNEIKNENKDTNKNVKIYVDHRETNSRIVPILEKLCTVELKQLNVADYLLSEHVAAERKTTKDFVESIISQRLFPQLAELKGNFEVPLLIIEGEDVLKDTKRNIHPNAIRGAIAAVAVNHHVPILWTKTQKETADLLFCIAKREQIKKEKTVSIRGEKRARSENEAQEFLVSGLPGINTTTAERMLEFFETPEKIFTASEEDLKKIEKIGDEKAKKIRFILTKKYEKSILK